MDRENPLESQQKPNGDQEIVAWPVEEKKMNLRRPFGFLLIVAAVVGFIFSIVDRASRSLHSIIRLLGSAFVAG